MNNLMETRIATERAIASAIMNDPETGYKIDINLNDFYDEASRAVIGSTQENGEYLPAYAMKFIRDNNLNVKMSEISENIVMSQTVTSHNVEKLCDNLKQIIVECLKEEARASMQERLRGGADPQATQMELEDRYHHAEMYFSSNKRRLLDSMHEIISDVRNKRKNELFVSNWKSFDFLHGGGLLGNELVVLAARPACGKTAAALQICCDCNVKTVFFSLEMNHKQVANRLLSHIAQINTKAVVRTPDQVSPAVAERIFGVDDILNVVCDRITVYDEPSQTVSSIRKIARDEVRNNGAKLIVIDYLQLITPENGKRGNAANREQEVAGISRALKNMSKELNIPVIVLAQLSRKCESEDREPRMGDLRESGAIEQDANSILFLVPDDSVPPDMIDKSTYRWVKMILAKGRDVGQAVTASYFNFNTQTFEEIDPEVIKKRNTMK